MTGAVVVSLVTVPFPDALVVAYAGVVGVAIDLDHFPIARYTTGDWSALKRCVTSPRRAFLDQREIFSETAVWPLQRLLSHAVIAGVVTLSLLIVSVPIAIVTSVTLYVHVVSDLIADVRRHDEYHRRHARYVREYELETTPSLTEESRDELPDSDDDQNA